MDAAVGPATTRHSPRGLRKHPPGTLLLCFVEMLERFSFYAMSGLLALFLAGSPAAGGFGWPALLAIQVYGIYVGLLWVTPLIGGWIGDHKLGTRRAVIFGGFLIAAGQALMATPALVPPAIEWITGVPVGAVLAGGGIPLGQPFLDPAGVEALAGSLARITGTGATAPGLGAVVLAYRLPAFGFFAGLALLAIGNGLLKPNITAMLGEMYAPSDPQRDEAFTLFYIGINVGAVLSALLAGTVAEHFGWALGFGVSSLIVLFGIAVMLRLTRLFPPGIGDRRMPVAGVRPERLPPGPLAQVIILMLFAAIFWGAFMQTFGLLSLFAYKDVDRGIAGFVVPAAWFSSLTPFFLTMVGPLFQMALNRLSARGIIPSALARFVAGFLIAAFAFAVLAAAIGLQAEGGRTAMIWLILFYLLLSVGELSLSPAGNAMATRHASPAVAGRLMAIWFLCYGLGSFLSSLLGGLSAYFSIPMVLAILSGLLLAAGLLLWLMRRPIGRLTEPAGAAPHPLQN